MAKFTYLAKARLGGTVATRLQYDGTITSQRELLEFALKVKATNAANAARATGADEFAAIDAVLASYGLRPTK